MSQRLIDRLVAGAVFIYALVLYVMTMAPTASFWDCGEFIAISHGLEVSHPPGAPFFMLIGRLFSFFTAGEGAAYAINMVSVLSSALTILLTHLIIVRLIREWKGHPDTWSSTDRFVTLAGAAIGAMAYAATDSFWFNAVEAEVYSMSMFFTALTVWLIMKWSEAARLEEEKKAQGHHIGIGGMSSSRYLVIIAYMFGLAIGVHLLNLLTLFFIAPIIYFTAIDEESWSNRKRIIRLGLSFGAASLFFFLIYPGIIQWLPTMAGLEWPGITGKEEAHPLLFIIGLVSLIVFGLYQTQKLKMQMSNLLIICTMVVIIGYSSYAIIFIRSAANPPIDENDPETTESIVSYLKREQYGSTPLLSGNTYDNNLGRIDPNKSVTFPRRYSPDPRHTREYAKYDSDKEFFFGYQINHMYLRYFLWNFSGRASDIQDAPWIAFPDEEKTQLYQYRSPSERASKNAYFALPLLLGIIGIGLHFLKDQKRAFSVMVLFLISGLGIIIYLNQTPLQPRERDYAYVASFFAFALWIGIGATGLLELIAEGLKDKASSMRNGVIAAGALVLVAAVPLNLVTENYDDHNRSGRYIAPDYARNMLESLAPNAIIFTNGDNDTFPLWYLQEVEGVRQDVRVANLSLLNTPWYIKQMKTQVRSSDPLPISFNEEQMDKMGLSRWDPREITLPVNKAALFSQGEVDISYADTNLIGESMSWKLNGRPYSQDVNVLYVADQVALDMIVQNARNNWERPIYFAITVAPSGQLDLQDHFQLEGLAYRIVPIKHRQSGGRVVSDIMLDRLSKFRFTNLNQQGIYYDENIRRMTDNYRHIYVMAAEALIRDGRQNEANDLLNKLMEDLPLEVIPGDIQSMLLLSRTYEALGNTQMVITLATESENIAVRNLKYATGRQRDRAISMFQAVQGHYFRAKDWDRAAALSNKLADALEDETLRTSADEFRRQFGDMVDQMDQMDQIVEPPANGN